MVMIINPTTDSDITTFVAAAKDSNGYPILPPPGPLPGSTSQTSVAVTSPPVSPSPGSSPVPSASGSLSASSPSGIATASLPGTSLTTLSASSESGNAASSRTADSAAPTSQSVAGALPITEQSELSQPQRRALTAGQIAAVVVGIAFGVLLLALAARYVVRKRSTVTPYTESATSSSVEFRDEKRPVSQRLARDSENSRLHETVAVLQARLHAIEQDGTNETLPMYDNLSNSR